VPPRFFRRFLTAEAPNTTANPQSRLLAAITMRIRSPGNQFRETKCKDKIGKYKTLDSHNKKEVEKGRPVFSTCAAVPASAARCTRLHSQKWTAATTMMAAVFFKIR